MRLVVVVCTRTDAADAWTIPGRETTDRERANVEEVHGMSKFARGYPR
jgi:hypothetical protein